MTDLLRSWVLGLAGAAVFCAVATALCPPGQVKRVVELLCGVVMAAALLAPLGTLDLGEYGLNLARYRAAAAELTQKGQDARRELDRTVIARETEAYILDKARALGAPLETVKVTLTWSTEGFWYPTAVELRGPAHAGLARAIAAELGVSEEAQIWRTDEDP